MDGMLNFGKIDGWKVKCWKKSFQDCFRSLCVLIVRWATLFNGNKLRVKGVPSEI